MAVNLSPVYGVAGQLFDNNGNPLAGGKIYTYLAGTTTNAATYTNASGTIAHSNPIVLDGAGRVPSGEIWLTDGTTYKFIVEDSANNLIGTYDNLAGINSNFINFTGQQEIQTATAGQTVFTLTTMQYQPGTNSLSVFVDGVNQYGPGAQYAFIETSTTVVTFVSGLHVGASVKFTTSITNNVGVTDSSQVTYDPPFANSQVTNVEAKLAQTVSIIDFGADPTGVIDSTQAIKNAISAAECIYCPTGTYLISEQLDIGDKTFYGDGFAQTIFETNMAVGQYAAITFGKLGWTTASDTTSGGYLGGFAVKRKVNTNYVIAVMVTGCHNGTIQDIKTQEHLIGCYVENTSELSMTQFIDVASNWSFVFDNRSNRTSGQRPGGYTGTGNDVSSCTLNMLTSTFSQQNAILFMNCGTMNLTGATITVFADNFSTNPLDMPYGFPVSFYGINFYGSPAGNWTRNSNITGVVFEADQGQGNARTCINIFSDTSAVAPIDNITFDSCEVQTYSAYVPNNDCTCFIQTTGPASGDQMNINITARNCGYTYATTTNTYYTGKLFNMVGSANIYCDQVYPLTALSNSTLSRGFNYRNIKNKIIDEIDIYGTTTGVGNVPSGWTGTGAYATKLEKVAPGNYTPASLNFNGGSGAVGITKTIDYEPYMFDSKQIMLVVIYEGTEPIIDFNVNNQVDTNYQTISTANTARYGNAQYYPTNSNTYKIRIISFPEFSALNQFRTLTQFSIGIDSLNAADSCKLYYFGFGYVPQIAKINPFG